MKGTILIDKLKISSSPATRGLWHLNVSAVLIGAYRKTDHCHPCPCRQVEGLKCSYLPKLPAAPQSGTDNHEEDRSEAGEVEEEQEGINADVVCGSSGGGHFVVNLNEDCAVAAIDLAIAEVRQLQYNDFVFDDYGEEERIEEEEKLKESEREPVQ